MMVIKHVLGTGKVIEEFWEQLGGGFWFIIIIHDLERSTLPLATFITKTV